MSTFWEDTVAPEGFLMAQVTQLSGRAGHRNQGCVLQSP